MDTPASKLDAMTDTALKSLKDIALPQPVSWFPQTWGWLALAVCLVAVVATFALLSFTRYRSNKYRREAIAELDAIEREMRDPVTRAVSMHRLTELLKRVALAAWQREDVASLSGASWVEFLRVHRGKAQVEILSSLLESVEYRSDGIVKLLPSNVTSDAVSEAREWIGGHRVSA